MKARPRKPSARKPSAKKPAATGKRAAVARKAKATARPATAGKNAKAAKSAKASLKPTRAGLGARATSTTRAGRATSSTLTGVAAQAAGPTHATLAADCTIEHAPDLQQQLAKVLGERACVTLDFSAVKRCDTAGMQVLAAFIRERREAGGELELANLSEAFLATAKLLGLSALFENTKASA